MFIKIRIEQLNVVIILLKQKMKCKKHELNYENRNFIC